MGNRIAFTLLNEDRVEMPARIRYSHAMPVS